VSVQPSEDARWFTEEIQPHEPMLRAWLRAKFPQLHDHDDVVQDAYLRLFRAKGDGKLDHPKAYLYKTARNAALDRCRRGRILAFEPIIDAEESSRLEDKRPTAEDLSARDLELAMLTEAIRALPERCRTILVLRKHHGLSHREIAGRLGISPHTVNAQITAAMIKCRAYFQQQGLLPQNR
jgi:RNA polymerase sigma-70 factor (ECF subfamily)